MSDTVTSTFDEHLQSGIQSALLRFMICGSVDDGKNTLLERLNHDAGVQDLQSGGERLEAVKGEPDVSQFLEGLKTEREQNTGMDVAYRYFSTSRRKFIVADAPGHEQFTRSMALAASTTDLCVFLIDAEKGLMPQTKHHAYVASLLGVRQMVLVVNNMDRFGYDQKVFELIVTAFAEYAKKLAIDNLQTVPVSTLEGDNVTRSSTRMPWYDEANLLDVLETIPVSRQRHGPFRLSIQHVVTPDQGFGGFAGTVAQGTVRPGDEVLVLPSGRKTSVTRIATSNGVPDQAVAGQVVTLALADETEVGHGDIICSADDPPESADQFAVHIVWLNEEPLYPGRPYTVKIGNRSVIGQVTVLKHRVDVNTLDQFAVRNLAANDIGYGTLALDHTIPFEPHADCPTLGEFILIDRYTDATVGYGMIDFALWRATTVPWQNLDVTKAARAELMGQKPVVLWFTGLSGAGKSTIANLVAQQLHARGRLSYLLDGDNLRHGLNRDLGFRNEDRVENIRRVGEVAKLFVDSGVIVLVSLISPFRNERMMVRDMLGDDEFLEVFVSTPLEECERRDPKGLYARARSGSIRNFTGIDSPYEPPENPEVVLNTVDATPDALSEQIIAILEEKGVA